MQIKTGWVEFYAKGYKNTEQKKYNPQWRVIFNCNLALYYQMRTR